MTRRDILTATELALTASALSAAVYTLGAAAYRPGSVQWVPIATVGCLTALSFVGFAALLFVGRAALLLSADAVQAWRATADQRALRQELRNLPPSRRPMRGQGVRPIVPGDGRHARAMAAVAAEMPRSRPRTTAGDAATLPLPALDDTAVMAAVQ
jgi:hypothetical protein